VELSIDSSLKPPPLEPAEIAARDCYVIAGRPHAAAHQAQAVEKTAIRQPRWPESTYL
jgi:hypothetical protein